MINYFCKLLGVFFSTYSPYFEFYFVLRVIMAKSVMVQNKIKRSCKTIISLFNIQNCLHMTTKIGICSDFRYESNGKFVLGVGFFFFRQISTF